MKNFLRVLAALVAVVIIGILIIVYVDGKNPQSSQEEFQNAYDSFVFTAKSMPNKLLGTEDEQWRFEVENEKITFSQFLDWKDHTRKQYFEIYYQNDKIVIHQYDKIFTGNSNQGFYLKSRWRVFKNAENFSTTMMENFLDEVRNNGTDEGSYYSVLLPDYYPAWSWRNFNLGRNDDERENYVSPSF